MMRILSFRPIMQMKPSVLLNLVAVLAVACSVGCRVSLPAQTCSNLWLRTVEDRADWHLCQRGFAPNPTHVGRQMTDWEKGFRRGYNDGSLGSNHLPQGNYRPVWGEKWTDMLADEPALQAGYGNGYRQAIQDGAINVAQVKK